MFFRSRLEKLRKVWILGSILCCLGWLAFPQAGNCQEVKRISLEAKDELLGDVLDRLGEAYGKKFFYSEKQVDARQKVTVSLKNVTLAEALKAIFGGKEVRYEENENFVMIREVRNAVSTEHCKVRGVVRDENNYPMPGVTVVLKGTSMGFASDMEGNFKGELPGRLPMTLVFSFVGYETQEVTVKDTAALTVKMVPEVRQVDEVVVTGYANVKKESFTGAAVRVEKEDLLRVSSRNVIQALQVFDPSLRIMKNNEMGSDPNTMPEFYIRGRSGMGVMELDRTAVSRTELQNNPNQPLFIMDGYEVTVDKVYDFDPNRIESVTILKDAAATALYGSRAANGVIVIETVAPQPGKLRVSYDFTGELTVPDISDYNLMDASEKLEAERLAGFYDYNPEEHITSYHSKLKECQQKLNNVKAGVNTDWIALPLRNPFNHKHSLFVEGGSDAVRFGITMRYDMQNGVMKGSDRSRFGASFQLDYRTEKLQLRNEVSYDVTKGKDSPYGDFSEYTTRLPYVSYKDAEGNYLETLPWHSTSTVTGNSNNPYYEAKLMKNFSYQNYSTLTDNLGVNWYIMDGLQAKGQFSITKTDEWSENFVDPESGTFKADPFSEQDEFLEKGSLLKTDSETITWSFKAFANYVKTLGKHNVNFSVGVELNETRYQYESQNFRGFPSGELHSPMYAETADDPSFSDNHTRLSSVYAALNYSFQDIYLLDASWRTDGSSEFGTDNKTASFYAAGVGVNFHKYAFLSNCAWLSQLRLTGTYGQTGKVNFPPYAAKHTYQIMDTYYGTGNGVNLFYMGNDDLTWEKTNEVNVRFVLGLFQENITLEADWYNKQTKDLITDVTIPTSTGYSSYKDNLGEVRNRGYELILRANVFHNEDWDVILHGNLAHNENKIMKISESLKDYNNRVDEEFAKFEENTNDLTYAKPLMKYEEGGSLTSIWGMKSLGINPSDGQEIFVNRDGRISYDWVSSEQQILGDTEPEAQGSFGVNLRYKNFTMFASFLYEFGAQAYNSTLVEKVECVDLRYYNADKRVLTERWQHAGQATQLKDIADRTETTRPTSRFVQDYNAIDFTSFSLSYDFNTELIRKIGMSMLRLQFQMTDVAHISNVKQERGLTYPYSRTFNLSVNVTF